MSLSGVRRYVTAEEVGTETRGVIEAKLDGEVIGELHFVDYAGTCQIRMLRVEPAYQREGVATGLIEKLREYLPASRPAQFLMNADGRALRDAIFDEYAKPIIL